MNTHDLSQHLARLSEADREEWKRILMALKECEGDISLLPEHMQVTLAQLREKYQEPYDINVERKAKDEPIDSVAVSESDISTPFSLYVKNVLHRELCVEGETLQSAVKKAFEHKWLPLELKNKEICETKFSQYESEITFLNRWRENFAGKDTLDEITMAVGLAWFMKVYQLKQFFEAKP